MQDLLSIAIWTHQLFIALMFLLAGLNIYFISKEQMFHSLGKQIEFLAPQYYLILSALLFAGSIVWTIERFVIKIDVLIMIAVWFVILITTIIKYKRYKGISFGDIEAQKEFKKFAMKKYISDIVLLCMTTAAAYIL